MKLDIFWAAGTHKGNHRPDNQDSFTADGNLFAIADGMGGHKGGAEASSLAVNAIRKKLAARKKPQNPQTQKDISEAILTANQKIYKAAQKNPEDLGGMGTTLCAIYLNQKTQVENSQNEQAKNPPVFIAGNVGDSRIYSFQNETLTQISKDHNEEFNKHLLTRAVGTQPEVTADTWELTPFSADSTSIRYLLCSDGLTNEVSDSAIMKILDTAGTPATEEELNKIADELIKEALDNGGRDNITLIVVEAVCREPSFF